jgi:hypothetical protein
MNTLSQGVGRTRMDRLADIAEIVLCPWLELVDRSGLTGALRFTPYSRLIAPLAVMVVVSYLTSIMLAPLDERIRALRAIRTLGRLATLLLAVYMVYNVLGNAAFVLRRSGSSMPVTSGGLATLLVLGLLLFLDIRLASRRRRS